ncbi:Uncharacterized membrane protein YcaP, DUF421 family [Lentibacillus halodurans]|uniref:Uncharacterized membrane protein YcaP, DUF421 family n=1 Tax=Lentibacillus halodurans TaxID=237679 RepID=A0A1I0W2A2_9BACI|nr:DUF421 domain-containing protein [Lentibacillus halodurans]SFA82865.1 Uncharacterized membrane protein YcaP, DUF421 family [Lentibacillus halodurans]
MKEYLLMFADTIFGFLALFVMVKVLGKTQISALTPFDFISAIILGELVGNALFDKESGIPEIAFLVILWGALLYITEVITQKFKGTRAILEGQPAVIIHKGHLIYDVVKKNRLDIDQLQHLLRSKDVFSMEEVEYAILETDGTVSILKKSEYQIPTNSDLNVTTEPVKMARTIINDGEIVWDNLKEAKLTKKWLEEELRRQNITSVDEVFYAEWQENRQKLFVMLYHNKE